MAFDKVKTLRAAEKFLELGKIPAAIKEYCKIVASEPQDFTTLNMLGDLYARVGDQTAAISCFRHIAEHYREQDFILKAIAMYKKVDRLQPHDTEIATKLADLYASQDLVVEARAHYLFVAEAHGKAGATQQGLEVLRKIADLDPPNTEIRTKLAEGYLREGMNADAAVCFTEAGQHLLARGACDEAPEVCAKAIHINPADHGTLKGLLAAPSARGTADRAAEMLGGDSDNVQALRLLVRAHWWQRDTEKLKAALERLADAAEAAGLEKDERYALTQLTRLAPDQAHHVERLRELGGAEEDAMTEAFPEGAPPAFDSFAEPIADAVSETEEFIVGSTTASVPNGEFEFEWNTGTEVPEQWNQPDGEISVEQGFAFEAVVAEELTSSPDEVVLSGSDESDADSDTQSRNASIRAQELESVDFYIAQGYVDIALDTLDLRS